MPRISVLLPVYNTQESHLRESINSILSQTYRDFELLITDDASTDPCVERVIRSYHDPRIRYTRNEKNMGISDTRNNLVTMAQGEYLAIMDHDDISLPTRFEKQVAFLDAHPDVGICGTASKRFGRMFKNNVVRHPEHDASIRVELFFKCSILHPSAMIRRQIITDNGLKYESNFISANDRKLFIDIASFSKLHNLPEVLYLYRMHPNMTSRTKRQQIEEEQKKLRQYILDKLGITLSQEEDRILNTYLMRGRARIKDILTLQLIEQLLIRLVEANNLSNYLPRDVFAQTCARYFIKRCTNAMLYGRVSSRKLLAETTLPVHKIKKPALLNLFNRLKTA